MGYDAEFAIRAVEEEVGWAAGVEVVIDGEGLEGPG